MSYYNYDPFFNEDDDDNNQKSIDDTSQLENNNDIQQKVDNEYQHNFNNISSFDDDRQYIDEDRSITQNKNEMLDNPYLDYPYSKNQNDSFNGNNSFSSKDYPYTPKPKRNNTKVNIWIMLLIMIPILIITNVLTSAYMFDKAWTEAKSSFQAEIESKINSSTSKTPIGSNSSDAYIAYNVAKNELNTVIEIYATYNGGSSSGTGFIISKDGYILTNAHVVTYEASNDIFGRSTYEEICPTIQAQFKDNDTRYNLRVIDYNSELDLAVCKLESYPSYMRSVTFADSTALQYGEPCVAIGNAQGYGLAVTEGIVSAPIQYYKLASRNGALTAAIQHSAAINHGNSGGPLFNEYGMVIGINSFKLTNKSEDISVDGMGFAIPSTVAKDYINGLNIQGLNIQFTPLPTTETTK